MLRVMFADIRRYTAISEASKSNPQGLSRLLNRGFLSPMTRQILARRGTIDKYVGDCIMAFWNAPLDDPRRADHACESALVMLAELDRVNRELAVEAAVEGREAPADSNRDRAKHRRVRRRQYGFGRALLVHRNRRRR